MRSNERRRLPVLRTVLILLLDVLLAAALVLGDYVYTYRMPQNGVAAETGTASGGADIGGSTLQSDTSGADAAPLESAAEEISWKQKFADQFSDTVISTDTVYKSSDISVELTTGSYDSGTLDHSENGKHEKYGTKIYYTLADIYISSIDCLRTVFAEDTCGVGYEEHLTSMSERMQAVLAVNGDYYSNNHHKNNGTIIRNGTVYRNQPSAEETCVLFRDGTMKVYPPERFDASLVIADGAWQTWIFGPSLLDDNGNAKSDFGYTWDYIQESHPRTAIGYYEPGHYCLLVVDGRQADFSRGMFLEEMSQLFADLGCQAAYNLDGGHSSAMTMGGAIVTQPYKPERKIADAIALCEPEV